MKLTPTILVLLFSSSLVFRVWAITSPAEDLQIYDDIIGKELKTVIITHMTGGTCLSFDTRGLNDSPRRIFEPYHSYFSFYEDGRFLEEDITLSGKQLYRNEYTTVLIDDILSLKDINEFTYGDILPPFLWLVSESQRSPMVLKFYYDSVYEPYIIVYRIWEQEIGVAVYLIVSMNEKARMAIE